MLEKVISGLMKVLSISQVWPPSYTFKAIIGVDKIGIHLPNKYSKKYIYFNIIRLS